MVTTTAGQLITASLKLIGVLAASETPTASEHQDALLALNGWIDYLGTDRQTMLSIAREVFTLTSGQQAYTIGDGGDVSIEAPLTLDHVGLILPGSLPATEMQLTLLTDDAYAVLGIKALESNLPTQVMYERPTAQLGTLWVWPLPTDDTLQLAIYWPNAITQFSALNEEVSLAPAYYMAMRFNLAALLYPEYGIQPRQDVLQTAANSLSALKRANFRASDLGMDPALVPRGAGSYNILTDTGGLVPPVRLPGFVGPTYTTRSINFDAERTINFYPAFGEQGATPKTQGYLIGTPGMEPFIKADDTGTVTTGINAGPIRGLFSQDGRTFVVSGNAFAELYANQTYHTYGLVESDANPATFASNGQAGHQIFVVSGGHGYIFDLVANSFVNIAVDSEGFPTGRAVMGAFVDGYFLVLKRNSIQYNISNLENGLIWDGLDVAQVSESSDNVLSLVTNHREVWLLGSKTTEVWYNSGNASFPFQPIQGTFIEHGIAATFSAVRLDNTIFWLGADESGARMVWKAQGYIPQRVSNHAIEYFLNLAPRVDNAIAYAYQEEGHSFYLLYVPTMETTLVYDVSTNQWHERALWDERFIRFFPHLGRCHAFAFGQHLIGDRQSGTVYRQSLDLYSDNLVVLS